MYVKFTAHPGQRDTLARLLGEAAAGMAVASGCEIWIVNTSPSEPDAVWVTEVWASKAEHDASLAPPETRERIARVMPLLAAAAEATELTPVAGKGLTP